MADSNALLGTPRYSLENPGEVRLLRAADVAGMLALSVSEVYNLCDAGKLTKRYVGQGRRNFRIRSDEVYAYIESLPTEPRDDDGP
jgi:predicted DNA-binding transcriptional regulator AlpA